MAYDFPDDPAALDTYDKYTWDGEKWSLVNVTLSDFTIVEFNELFSVLHPDQLFTLPSVP